MTAPPRGHQRASRPAEAGPAPQLGLAATLGLFAWPMAWFSLLIYGLARPLADQGERVPTWTFLTVIILGSGAEGLVGLVLLRRERRQVGVDWRERIRWRWPRGWRLWLLAGLVLVLGVVLAEVAAPANRALAETDGFIPPSWWPAASDPRAEVTSAADAFPDVSLAGNLPLLLGYLLAGLVNVVGEETYYRGYLLPRMRGVFGRWDWVANGVLFTLKHVYQRWLYPGILVGGLAFAFAAGPLRSLPLAMLFHWIGNFLFTTVALAMDVLG